tara:strand:- start:193 stop:594 length:402 start_codon:yes stop_codon:yes gene_type:complete
MTSIGKIAQNSGVTVEAVRYYEKQGLILKPDRDANGYRRYSKGAARQVRFIKRAQEVGFTLKDIKELLSLKADPEASCCDVRARAERKVQEMEDRIITLTRMKDVLSEWVTDCEGQGPTSECPILDALDAEET